MRHPFLWRDYTSCLVEFRSTEVVIIPLCNSLLLTVGCILTAGLLEINRKVIWCHCHYKVAKGCDSCLLAFSFRLFMQMLVLWRAALGKELRATSSHQSASTWHLQSNSPDVLSPASHCWVSSRADPAPFGIWDDCDPGWHFDCISQETLKKSNQLKRAWLLTHKKW